MRRVVVTGLGMVSPLSDSVDGTWKRLIEGHSGAGPVTLFDTEGYPCKIGCEVKLGDGSGDTFNADEWMEPKDQRRVDNFIIFGMAAAIQAVRDAGWEEPGEEECLRTGVMIGAGIGGLRWISDTSLVLHERGVRRVSPHFIAGSIINLASGNVSIKYGFKGPNHAAVTACSTGAHSIGDAARIIALDDADVMVAGGTEASICGIGYAGFCQAKALSTHYNDDPSAASRPWDKGHDGFVMGEGAGVVVLEELEHAKKRGAKIYAEIVGYGMSGDGYHVTAPAPDGNGGYRAMEAALKRAGMAPGDLDYINAHGTSTPVGDPIEFGAVKRLLGDAADKIAMSSTKSSIGHLLGAAGAVEAIFCIKSITDNVVPPTLNLHERAEGCDGIDLVALEAQERNVKAALSNSFGFGGTNASLVMREYNGD
ncbi:beta-ketoacyl-ACP synthase II [Kordiimonas lipolytica]|uniref:3-oxoacyl-[acyl-carrier-protein] synthase 2 n=1 Tax=Kordiimonas lipolytica TaxID=1662421 RepID=A0ABV8UCR1_9PROT|nr:beta-ketoacyl-ACP synthase II [Kordiimonas lipolytica]